MAALNAWMNGELVGVWEVQRGVHSFTYDPSWPRSDRYRPLSLSLPLTATAKVSGDVVANYFDNLLPDNPRIRERIGRRFGARADTFSLLQAIGRDCVGAVQLLPPDSEPEGGNRIDCQPLDEAEIAAALRAVPADPLGTDRGEGVFRISLAGAQEKTAFTRIGDAWARPEGATPSTHIFKLPLGTIANASVRLFDSVQNEWLCAQILQELGLPVAHVSMETFEDQQVLIVERFDRDIAADHITRLPQEDFCQALGVPPARKYENDGGPGIDDALRLLSGSTEATNDRIRFLVTQLCFWLMAATDGHAKNYSIFLRQGGAYDMTPLYDVLSMWPYVGGGRNQLPKRDIRMAMALRSKNAHYDLFGIMTRHWHELAMKNGGPEVWEAMLDVAGRVGDALARVESGLPPGFPENIWNPIANGMRAQADKFLQQAGALG